MAASFNGCQFEWSPAVTMPGASSAPEDFLEQTIAPDGDDHDITIVATGTFTGYEKGLFGGADRTVSHGIGAFNFGPQLTYVDISNAYEDTGNDGTSDDPLNWDEFMEAMGSGEAYNFRLWGAREVTASDAYLAASNVETTVDAWDIEEPWAVIASFNLYVGCSVSQSSSAEVKFSNGLLSTDNFLHFFPGGYQGWVGFTNIYVNCQSSGNVGISLNAHNFDTKARFRGCTFYVTSGGRIESNNGDSTYENCVFYKDGGFHNFSVWGTPTNCVFGGPQYPNTDTSDGLNNQVLWQASTGFPEIDSNYPGNIEDMKDALREQFKAPNGTRYEFSVPPSGNYEGYELSLFGSPRSENNGIGAFNFDTDTPTIYIDISTENDANSGTAEGTQSDPYIWSQFLSLLPQSEGSRFLLRGSRDVDDDVLFVGGDTYQNVVDAWDKKKPWRIKADSITYEDQIVRLKNGIIDSELVLDNTDPSPLGTFYIDNVWWIFPASISNPNNIPVSMRGCSLVGLNEGVGASFGNNGNVGGLIENCMLAFFGDVVISEASAYGILTNKTNLGAVNIGYIQFSGSWDISGTTFPQWDSHRNAFSVNNFLGLTGYHANTYAGYERGLFGGRLRDWWPGIGGFWFGGESQTFYVDLGQDGEGEGVYSDNPYNFAQFLEELKSDDTSHSFYVRGHHFENGPVHLETKAYHYISPSNDREPWSIGSDVSITIGGAKESPEEVTGGDFGYGLLYTTSGGDLIIEDEAEVFLRTIYAKISGSLVVSPLSVFQTRGCSFFNFGNEVDLNVTDTGSVNMRDTVLWCSGAGGIKAISSGASIGLHNCVLSDATLSGEGAEFVYTDNVQYGWVSKTGSTFPDPPDAVKSDLLYSDFVETEDDTEPSYITVPGSDDWGEYNRGLFGGLNRTIDAGIGAFWFGMRSVHDGKDVYVYIDTDYENNEDAGGLGTRDFPANWEQFILALEEEDVEKSRTYWLLGHRYVEDDNIELNTFQNPHIRSWRLQQPFAIRVKNGDFRISRDAENCVISDGIIQADKLVIGEGSSTVLNTMYLRIGEFDIGSGTGTEMEANGCTLLVTSNSGTLDVNSGDGFMSFKNSVIYMKSGEGFDLPEEAQPVTFDSCAFNFYPDTVPEEVSSNYTLTNCQFGWNPPFSCFPRWDDERDDFEEQKIAEDGGEFDITVDPNRDFSGHEHGLFGGSRSSQHGIGAFWFGIYLRYVDIDNNWDDGDEGYADYPDNYDSFLDRLRGYEDRYEFLLKGSRRVSNLEIFSNNQLSVVDSWDKRHPWRIYVTKKACIGDTSDCGYIPVLKNGIIQSDGSMKIKSFSDHSGVFVTMYLMSKNSSITADSSVDQIFFAGCSLVAPAGSVNLDVGGAANFRDTLIRTQTVQVPEGSLFSHSVVSGSVVTGGEPPTFEHTQLNWTAPSRMPVAYSTPDEFLAQVIAPEGSSREFTVPASMEFHGYDTGLFGHPRSEHNGIGALNFMGSAHVNIDPGYENGGGDGSVNNPLDFMNFVSSLYDRSEPAVFFLDGKRDLEESDLTLTTQAHHFITAKNIWDPWRIKISGSVTLLEVDGALDISNGILDIGGDLVVGNHSILNTYSMWISTDALIVPRFTLSLIKFSGSSLFIMGGDPTYLSVGEDGDLRIKDSIFYVESGELEEEYNYDRVVVFWNSITNLEDGFPDQYDWNNVQFGWTPASIPDLFNGSAGDFSLDSVGRGGDEGEHDITENSSRHFFNYALGLFGGLARTKNEGIGALWFGDDGEGDGGGGDLEVHSSVLFASFEIYGKIGFRGVGSRKTKVFNTDNTGNIGGEVKDYGAPGVAGIHPGGIQI